MRRYINFYFSNLTYNDDFFRGVFSAPDNEIYCEFEYDRKTRRCRIWNNNKPEHVILPLPIWWLDIKLKENGRLNDKECRICY